MTLGAGKTCGSLANTALSSAGGVLILSDQVYPPNQPSQPPSERWYSLPLPKQNLRILIINYLQKSMHHWYTVRKFQKYYLWVLCHTVCAALQYRTTACIQLQSHHTSTLTEPPTTGFDLPKALVGTLSSSKHYVKKSMHQKECFLRATSGYLLRRSHKALRVT